MRDWTLPGYKYLGPGNQLDKGEPNNYDDWVAFMHDLDYGHIEDAGGDPYKEYSDADDVFLQRIGYTYGGILGQGWFRSKQLLYKLGLISRFDVPRLQMAGGKRKYADDEPEWAKRGKHDGSYSGPVQMEIDDDGTIINRGRQSLPNLPKRTQVQSAMTNGSGTGDGDGSGNAIGLKETPIDNPHNVFRGPPDYTFVSLPYAYDLLQNQGNAFANDYIFRMTSPYDCNNSTTITDLNAGAGTTTVFNADTDAADAAIEGARWYNFYAGMYNYYHVISCQYHVFIENLGGEDIWAYVMFMNDEQPPTGATNQDMQLWSGVKYQYLASAYKSILSTGVLETGQAVNNAENRETGTNTSGNDTFETSNNVTSRNGHVTAVFTGTYRTGDFKRQIRLDSEVENWTAVTTNPALPEKLVIRIKPQNDSISLNDANNYGDDYKIRLRVKLNYLVEFKELKTGLRYPVQRQPITVTIANDASSGN